MDQETLERKSAAAGRGGLTVDREMMAFETDGGIGTKAALGLLVLETDQTIEDEFRFLLPERGVALYGARLHNDAKITPEMLASMTDAERGEVIRVTVTGDQPKVNPGQQVRFEHLEAIAWNNNGKAGVAYRAAAIAPAQPSRAA